MYVSVGAVVCHAGGSETDSEAITQSQSATVEMLYSSKIYQAQEDTSVESE